MLMRFDPIRDLDRLVRAPGRPGLMAIDAYRQGDRFVVQLDVPGIDVASVDLTVEKNVLSVRAERPVAEVEGAEWLVDERPHGHFTRQLFLGEGLDTDHIEAGYDHGVLTVTIPVAEASKPRKVEITGPGGARAIQSDAGGARATAA